MKNETKYGMSRRCFIKRSTIAAIAAMNLMMFTGLVNAADESPSPEPDPKTKCNYTETDERFLEGHYFYTKCYFASGSDLCSIETRCGIALEGIPGFALVKCNKNNTEAKAVKCLYADRLPRE